jgi:3-oxoacyl-[acyl-carrier protein] reductase
MDLGIAGKRALVVGGTKSTGSAVVKALRDEGVEVTTLARSGADINANCMAPQERPIHGDPDIIVHVVGGSVGVKDPMSMSSQYREVWRLNIGNAIAINNAVLPAMIERGWGRIVHLSSNAVKLAIGHVPYASAKAAVEGYVRNMGKELAPKGVVMTAVRPGPIYSEGKYLYSQSKEWTDEFQEKYVPMKRWGRPEELASVVCFLCSDKASYMAGAIIDVDGGMR